jgi:outer membrane lipoprotein-sorting protein
MKKLMFLTLVMLASVYSYAISDADALKMIKTLDERETSSGDYKAQCFVKETERGKDPKVFQIEYFRRDIQNKIIIFFIKPKEEAGKGYLKIDKNLWMYDPNTGKWDRRTERERIGGTNSRRSDFDESRLAEEYKVKFIKDSSLGDYKTYIMELTAKDGIDVAYQKLILNIDQENNNLLKREEYSLSGKLMRTTYYPKWIKEYSKSKKGDVWVPKEMRIIDELEKGNTTTILITTVDFSPLEDNMFTKAWLEKKSR